MKKKLLSLLLVVVMVLGMLPASVLATEVLPTDTPCLTVSADAPAAGKTTAGALYELDLATVFSHVGDHEVSYSFASTVSNEHTKIKDGVFYFSAPAGSYEVTLQAKCADGEAIHKLAMTVEKGNDGIAAQYNYDETPASSVTVYVTLSNDGYPIKGIDDTVLSHLEVTVPYFDLALYGLEDYYRYGTDGGKGIYTTDTLITRPTGLHLYIYLLERYYMGLDAEDCGKGLASGVLSSNTETAVYYMDGTKAYDSDGKQALMTTGGPTSIYMTNFWGHDENLMYYRNHVYPYMDAGWGSTSDYILLSDGDTWDVAMFSNWNFYNYGFFACFDQDNYTAKAGDQLSVMTQAWGTSAAASKFIEKNGLSLGLYNSDWELIRELSYDTETGNQATFKVPEEAGTYYLMALDPNAQDAKDACIAPATAVLTVEEKTQCETCADENSDKICDVCGKNLNKLPHLIAGVEDLTVIIQTGMSYQLHDVSGGKIFTDDDDTLTSENYKMRKSSDGGKTWSDWEIAFKALDFGGITDSVVNSTAGVYTYEFKAFDSFGESEDTWTLTLDTRDKVPANVSFYLGRDHQYSTKEGAEFTTLPVLELYVTAGIDENYFDYIGWFQKGGETVYVYDPQDYTIIDGETDYVEIDGARYELHDYEKVAFTNSAFDAADESATASGTAVDGYNMFYATIETGRYSTRVYGYNTESGKYDIYLGGQSMELPREKDIYGNGGNDIYLRQVSVYTASKKLDSTYFTADEYYAEMIMPITGSMIHAGDPYVSGNYAYYPFFSWAAGNGSLYNVYVYPNDTDNYIFTQAINQTTGAGTSVVTKSMTISTAVKLMATVPAEGDFGLYFQYNNFNTKEVEPVGEAVVNSDGTKTITYKVSKGNGNYTWRLTDPSGTYVTKAGWLKCSADTEKTFTFSEFTNKASHDFSQLGTQVITRDEADIQVFLSDTGFKGGVSEKNRIRAYRMWQIIDTDSANIMVEPDFNIQVLQGNESDITPVSGGNVTNNWIDVIPTTTDIVAVNYDALEVYNTSDAYGSHGGFYPATSPERTNVFIISNETAGKAVAHIPFNGSKTTDRGAEWDYNYDTWFYLDSEEAPKLNFTVTGGEGVTVSYATVITDASLKSNLSGWTTVTADENGNYYADLLKFRNAGTKGGTIIIKMTDSTGTSYSLVRAAEFIANVTNVSNPGEPFMPGDEVSVTFDGMYRSINKISGVFNPLKYELRYTSAGAEVSGSLGQYKQMDLTSIKLTIPADLEFPEGEESVDYTFTNGYVFGTMYSASSPFATMYYMTDTGMGTNFSAVGTEYVLSRVADIPITVYQKATYDVKIEVNDGENILEGVTFELTAPDGTVLIADENGIYQDLGYGDYSYAVSKKGYIGQNDILHLGSANAESVVDGILKLTFTIEKAAEGAWDGETITEPAVVDGVYQISNGAELAWVAETVNAGTLDIDAVLTGDIDLAGYNWTPIGHSKAKYSGTFDGKGYKIKNFVIFDEAYSGGGAALVGHGDNCTVQNLTVVGSIDLTSADSVSSAYAAGVIGSGTLVTLANVHSAVDITITRVKGNWVRVGGIMGSGTCETITNCSYTGTLNGYQYCGGIAGYLSKGTVSNCYNAGTIYAASKNAGGIVGSGAPVNIIGCYNIGAVTAKDSYAGGIVSNDSTGTISNCFNAGAVSAADYVGAIAGNVSKADAVLAHNYYLEGTNAKGIGATKGEHTVEMVSAETMGSAEFVATMNAELETPAYVKGDAYPILAWQGGGAEEPAIIPGDANGDGEVSMNDYIVVLNAVRSDAEMTEQEILAADVNGDGEVSMKDYVYILQFIRGDITEFPAKN